MGKIWLQLDLEKAPASTANFIRYVDEDFYDDTIFHRVVANFVIQGGGFEHPESNDRMSRKDPQAPIVNESSNGLSNKRGTIAMARTNIPDSATSQFYINLQDNINLDARPGQPGYAVFGKVIKGMDVVDKIGGVNTTRRAGYSDVPKKIVYLNQAKQI
jgi:cyclophilin family peptidyl-prolyl cis-trans isomerase